MDPGRVVKRADEAGLRLVRFLWCGNDGTVRAKASSRHGLEAAASEAGIGAHRRDAGDERPRPPPAGRGHGAGRRDPAGARPRHVPRAALRAAHRRHARRPARARRRGRAGRPARRSSSGMADRLAERGARLEVAFENEFALATHDDDGDYVPIDSSLCFSTIGMTASQDYVDDLVEALEAQGIPLEQYYAELGHGQQEISTAHRPARPGRRRAAPRARDDPRRRRRARARRDARAEAVARGRGQRLPHPLLAVGPRRRAQPLPRPRRARTASPPRAARSSPACSTHLPGLCGLTAPSFNSYHRIVPQYWAGAFTCWGHDNREAPLRAAVAVPRHGGGLDEPRAQGLRRDLQPVPRDRRRSSRPASTASSAGSSRPTRSRSTRRR